MRERCFQLVECVIGLDGLGEALVLLQESVEGHALFVELRDEVAQSGQAAQHLLHPFKSRIGPIQSRTETFSGLGFMPR
jgi:hypothetical protein